MSLPPSHDAPGIVPSHALEWHLACLLSFVGVFMLVFQLGWRAPLESLTVPGLGIHPPSLAWPGMLFLASWFQLFALIRERQYLRRFSAAFAAFTSIVMAISFIQGQFLVVGAPIFILVAVSEAVVATILRDCR